MVLDFVYLIEFAYESFKVPIAFILVWYVGLTPKALITSITAITIDRLILFYFQRKFRVHEMSCHIFFE